MENKEALKFNTAGMMILALTLLTDRFIHPLPDWMACILALAAALLIGMGLYKGFRNSRQDA